MKELTSFEGIKCANCTAPLQGEYCHHCGQSMHSVLRPVHGLVEEFFETILHIDGRIWHTLPALFLQPGFLTLEYFSGRRMRYIAPFRLMFVLCLLSFFTLHLAAEVIANRADQHHRQALIIGASNNFDHDDTAAEVRQDLSRKLAILDATRADNAKPGGNPAIVTQIDATEQNYRHDAQQRLTELGAPATAAAAAASITAIATASRVAAPAPPSVTEKPSDNYTMAPVAIHWLPAWINERLTTLGQHVLDNMHTLLQGSPTERQEARERLITNVFGALPGTMLVLIPTFALLLTLFYLLQHRLYMEHLIVALHSHAFIFLSLLLVTVAGMLSTWLRPHAAWTGWVLGLPQLVVMVWLPIYLLLMQKRIYRQGWGMTIVKFWLIGWCYFWLLSFALSVAAVLGLTH